MCREDSRLHACIVCASISCPDIRMEAFRPEKISQQMTDQVTKFLANPKKGEHTYNYVAGAAQVENEH